MAAGSRSGSKATRQAERLFEDFHGYEATELGAFPFSIPAFVEDAGPTTAVMYRSAKWKRGTFDYIHRIESRVVTGVVGRGGRQRRVPARIRAANQVLARIGKTLGWTFVDGDGAEIEARAPSGSEWYWSIKGRALLVVEKRRRLHAIVWGGRLNVEARGIVG